MAADNDLIQELQEDARAASLANFWKAYGNTLVVACVLIVLGTAAGVYWKHRTAGLAEEQTSLFLRAVAQAEQGESKQAAEAFGRIARLGGKIYPLAVLRQAQALQESNDDQGAINALQVLAEDEKADLLMRSVAALWIIRLADAEKQPKVIEKLIGLLTQKDNPLHVLGEESKALWLLQQNKIVEAQAVLKALADSGETPTSIAQRARAVMRTAVAEGK